MAIDTPAKLGIIGAGPVGLEACLYARFLGYEVLLFESASAGHRLEYDQPLGAFGDFSSSLARAAIAAQNPDQSLPLLTETLTARQWHNRYLLPLSQCDLVGDCLRTGFTVTRVSKEHLEANEVAGFERGGYDFLIETIDASGAKNRELVDGLIDASGWSEQGNGEPMLFSYLLSLELQMNPDSRLPPICAYDSDELPDGTKLTEDAKRLILNEPNFYVLGEKTLGEKALLEKHPFSYHNALDQIRSIFTILGDRTSLDLYATAAKLPQ